MDPKEIKEMQRLMKKWEDWRYKGCEHAEGGKYVCLCHYRKPTNWCTIFECPLGKE
jgi:hypothetical protein